VNVTTKNTWALATAIVGAIFGSAPQIANACATCGLSDGDAAFHAYKASVLFMLVSPYASFAAIGGITYFVYKRSQRKNENSTTK
jgi:hypothetical protein